MGESARAGSLFLVFGCGVLTGESISENVRKKKTRLGPAMQGAGSGRGISRFLRLPADELRELILEKECYSNKSRDSQSFFRGCGNSMAEAVCEP